MLPEMRIQRTVGAGIPSAVHVMLSDVLYSFSTISLILGATTDVKLNALLNGLLLAQKNKKFYCCWDRQSYCVWCMV